jgi:hypothetical protein
MNSYKQKLSGNNLLRFVACKAPSAADNTGRQEKREMSASWFAEQRLVARTSNSTAILREAHHHLLLDLFPKQNP